MTAAIEQCRDSIERHSKSFALASRLLPDHARDPARAVYAWCRRADDAVDVLAGNEGVVPVVRRLEDELDSIYAGQEQRDPVLSAFQEVVWRCQVPKEYPVELLRGMRMDAEGHRYRGTEDLLLYGYRVASTVGLMMCHVLGVRSRDALKHAAHLGIAMQITNICRDVLEDWGRARLYVPHDLLTEVGAGDLPPHLGSPFPMQLRGRVGEAVRRLLMFADEYYDSGARGLRYLDFRSALSVRTAMLVYSDIGRVVARRGHDVTEGRAVVSKTRKVFLLCRAAFETLLGLPERLRTSAPPSLHPPRLGGAMRFPQDVLPV